MTAGGDMNQEMHWDEARIALAEVARVLGENPGLSPEEILPRLYEVPNYGLIPDEVRAAVEGLQPEERRLVNDFFATLAKNHFYLENGHGALEIY